MSEATTKTMDVTPIFNYTRSIEIVKRFTEKLTSMTDPADELVHGYVAANIGYVRSAVSELMADDVKQQIADKVFPIRQPTLDLHAFVPYEPPGDWPNGKPEPDCNECGLLADAINHTL